MLPLCWFFFQWGFLWFQMLEFAMSVLYVVVLGWYFFKPTWIRKWKGDPETELPEGTRKRVSRSIETHEIHPLEKEGVWEDQLVLGESEIRPWINFQMLETEKQKAFSVGDRYQSTYGFQIGINYILTRKQLKGCINDALNIRSLFLANQVAEDHLEFFSDFTPVKPTKANIVSGLQRFLQRIPNGSNILVSFSGHGTRHSLIHETLCLLSENLQSVDLLLDNDLFSLVAPLLANKPDSRLFFIADSCFSENVMNLRYTYSPNAANTSILSNTNNQYQDTTGNIILISGSAKNQTSADVELKSTIAHGALTWTLLRYLYENRTVPFSFRDFILGINRKLKENRFSQTSCLSSSRPLHLDQEMRFP